MALEKLKKEIEKTQVIILAGGKAKRLGIKDKPKALIEVNSKPLLDYTLEMFSYCGFSDYVFILGHLHEQIEEHLDKNWKGKISYKIFVDPPGVSGKGKALKAALDEGVIDKERRAIIAFPDDFILDKELPVELLMRHLSGKKIFNTSATVALTTGTEYPFGVGEIDNNGLVVNFIEKPFINKFTSTGMIVVEPEVFGMIEKFISLDEPGSVEFESVILPILAKERKLYSFILPPGIWIPINTVKEQELVEKILKENRNNYLYGNK